MYVGPLGDGDMKPPRKRGIEFPPFGRDLKLEGFKFLFQKP